MFCSIDGRRQPLQTPDGNRSSVPAGVSHWTTFDEWASAKWFVHHSAYEEMIGFDHDSTPTEHREAITLHSTGTITGG